MIPSAPAPVSYGLVWALPFVGLLLTIGLAPLLVGRLWHRHYGAIVAAWAAAFVLPAATLLGPRPALGALLETALHQYLPFMLMLGTLYVVAGGLRMHGTPRGGPGVNTTLLAIGTVLASLVGTIGAALLMLRPLLRANRQRSRPTHVYVFYIFLVANIGGALTPLGNPPLLLGYLAGVPFTWPLRHLALPTLILAAGVLATFYALDRRMHRRWPDGAPAVLEEVEKLSLDGMINLPLLAIAVASVLLRSIWPAPSGVTLLGVTWRYDEIATDGLLLGVAVASLALTPRAIRTANDFAWEPLSEVGILFAAIFVTLIPLTAMLEAGLHGPLAPLLDAFIKNGVPDNALFYRGGGVMSALLDNAPTYLLFFGLAGGDPQVLTGPLATTLAAISAGTAYFGGLTYLGNAPNLMVKAIVERQGVPMPSFFGYLGWSVLCLLPWLLLIEALFFHGGGTG